MACGSNQSQTHFLLIMSLLWLLNLDLKWFEIGQCFLKDDPRREKLQDTLKVHLNHPYISGWL